MDERGEFLRGFGSKVEAQPFAQGFARGGTKAGVAGNAIWGSNQPIPSGEKRKRPKLSKKPIKGSETVFVKPGKGFMDR